MLHAVMFAQFKYNCINEIVVTHGDERKVDCLVGIGPFNTGKIGPLFRGAYCICHLGDELFMELANTFKTSQDFYGTTWRVLPQYSHFH
jgi:hypothetical protein